MTFATLLEIFDTVTLGTRSWALIVPVPGGRPIARGLGPPMLPDDAMLFTSSGSPRSLNRNF